MAVRIGHASKGETGAVAVKGGAAGDQTGKEVCVRYWYKHSKKWVVLRCKDAAKRLKIAEAMEKACYNPAIGYDQYQRDTLFNNVKDKGFDPSKTTKQVETDCSALVRVCIAYAYGEDKVGNIRTISEPATLVKSGLFEKLTADKYTASSDYLLRGDILCTSVSGHTCVVLDDGAKVVNSSASGSAASYTLTQFIKDVQKATGSAVDGEAGPETLGNTVTLSSTKNRKHPVVKYVQKRLYALGYTEVGPADGIAGTKFAEAVARYQVEVVGMKKPDGEITARNKTWMKLLGMA